MANSNDFKHTGLAIFFAFLFSSIFYFIYNALFKFFVGFYAQYDPTFAQGIGALILVVFGSNVFSFLSGSISSIQIFPKANRDGIFYGLSTVIVMAWIYSVMVEISRNSWSLFVVIILTLVSAITIYVIRIPLKNKVDQRFVLHEEDLNETHVHNLRNKPSKKTF